MSDKMLMENWRKFLAEKTLRDKDRSRSAGLGTGSPASDDEPKVPLNAPTVEEYMKWVEQTLKIADIEGKTTNLTDFGIGQDVGGGLAQNLDNVAQAIARDAQEANAKEMSKDAYRDNPFLIYVDIWDPYYDVIQEKIIENFLQQLESQLEQEGVGPQSPMPDIDQALERYIKNNYNEIILDGAPHAKDEWAKRARKNIEKLEKELPGPMGAVARGAGRSLQKLGRTAKKLLKIFGIDIDEFMKGVPEGIDPDEYARAYVGPEHWDPIKAEVEDKEADPTKVGMGLGESIEKNQFHDNWRDFLLTEEKL